MDLRLQLALWAGGCFVAGQLAHYFFSRLMRSRRWRHSAIAEIAAEVGSFAHGVGIPFAAMVGGALPQTMLGFGESWFGAGQWAGFSPQAWLRGVGAWAAALAFTLAVIWVARRASSDRLSHPPRSALAALRVALYSEPRWALYRAFPILLFSDAYLGSVVGFGVAVLEQALWASRAEAPHPPDARLRSFGLVLNLGLSSVLYLATQNLWLMVAGHAVVLAFIERQFASPAHRAAEGA